MILILQYKKFEEIICENDIVYYKVDTYKLLIKLTFDNGCFNTI